MRGTYAAAAEQISHAPAGRRRTPPGEIADSPRRAAGSSSHADAPRRGFFKFLFDLAEVCADALCVAAPALWPHLDPASVRILRAGDSVAADLSKRQGDALFGVDLREGALADGRRPYLVVPTEFQSGDDAGMLDRMREYAPRQLDTLRRQGVIPPGDTPPVLPLVVYDGAVRWGAADGLEPSCGTCRRRWRCTWGPSRSASTGGMRCLIVDCSTGAPGPWPATPAVRAVP